MSDEKLRELERRFKETGSVEDEAAWLKERVRVGDLTQERLELAAYLASGRAEFVQEWVPPAHEDWQSGAPIIVGEGDLAFRERVIFCLDLVTHAEPTSYDIPHQSVIADMLSEVRRWLSSGEDPRPYDLSVFDALSDLQANEEGDSARSASFGVAVCQLHRAVAIGRATEEALEELMYSVRDAQLACSPSAGEAGWQRARIRELLLAPQS